MEESNSKQQKSSEEDRISRLPDGVLLNHIFSRLPTKTVVTTGCLSRRWRNLWKNIQVLDFYDDSFNFKDGSYIDRLKSFNALVYKVLAHLNNPHVIRKMSLHCGPVIFNDKWRADSVDNWILDAIGPHLEELFLVFVSPGLRLHPTLFSCPNLVSLFIFGAIHVHVQSSMTISLPSLKLLQFEIHSLGYLEVSSVNAILGGCPNIEILDLNFQGQSSDKACLPPTLKRLKIVIKHEVGSVLEINAPDLKFLSINQYKFSDVLNMHNLHNVVEAHLDLLPSSFGSVVPLVKLLGALSAGTKHLLLGASTTKWLLGRSCDHLLQNFCHLRRLELILPWVNSNSLLCFLQKCPMLQVLLIQNNKEQSPILGWAPQPSVPKCLVSHLTLIKFKGFLGLPDEVSFVEHVLQKGLVLKTVIIADISLDLMVKYDILRRLSNVRRASIMCQLAFD